MVGSKGIIKDNDGNTFQCKYFVQRKKRYCRMTVRPGKSYCGEHDPAKESDGIETDTRVPCPLDPKHTCYASKLEKHLQICNARQVDLPPYVDLNVNNISMNVTPRIPLSEVSKETLNALIKKIHHLYDKLVSNAITSLQATAIHPVVLEDFNQENRTETSLRHLRQVSSLLHLLEQEGLVEDGTCYVELGAGKGHLSYYMSRAWCSNPNSSRSVLLVDRASLRHKRDNRLRVEAGSGDGVGGSVGARRLRVDVAHLSLARVSPPPGAERGEGRVAYVAVAKHLCGVAIDLSLRCMTNADILPQSRGVVLATCCHHRCDLHNYVACNHLQELGITIEELNVMLSVVSWATCGDGCSRERRKQIEQTNRDHVTNVDQDEGKKLTREQRELVGRKAKALVDWGRVLYLRSCGFEARLCYFVDTSVSLENVCIVAKKPVSVA